MKCHKCGGDAMLVWQGEAWCAVCNDAESNLSAERANRNALIVLVVAFVAVLGIIALGVLKIACAVKYLLQ